MVIDLRVVVLGMVLVIGFGGGGVSEGAEGVTVVKWGGKQDKWKGWVRWRFKVDGRKCYVVLPRKEAEGRPWVWRARFPDYHAEVDLKLLEKGYHVAYMDVAGMFGSPKAVGHGNAFYKYLTGKYGFNRKVVLEGVSRGGLFIYNWGVENVEKIGCMYADTPVCDFKSWPGGKEKGRGHAGSWKQCLKAYGLSEAEGMAYRKNPVDRIGVIAKAGIQVLHIVSENDVIVPPKENTYRMFGKVEAGVRKKLFKVISVAKGTVRSGGHHFKHEHVDEVVGFILESMKGEGRRKQGKK